jgi:hypothetical protein
VADPGAAEAPLPTASTQHPLGFVRTGAHHERAYTTRDPVTAAGSARGPPAELPGDGLAQAEHSTDRQAAAGGDRSLRASRRQAAATVTAPSATVTAAAGRNRRPRRVDHAGQPARPALPGGGVQDDGAERRRRGVIVGMVGTRFAGLDGVSLEADKLATILQEDGHQVVWFASELGDRFRPGTTHPPAHFTHPANRALQPELFGTHPPTPATIRTLRERTGELRVALGWFLREYEVEVAIIQNALALPVNVPLGVALAEVLVETGLPLSATTTTSPGNASGSATPAPPPAALGVSPALPGLWHLVINTTAARHLRRRRGIAAAVLPNVGDATVRRSSLAPVARADPAQPHARPAAVGRPRSRPARPGRRGRGDRPWRRDNLGCRRRCGWTRARTRSHRRQALVGMSPTRRFGLVSSNDAQVRGAAAQTQLGANHTHDVADQAELASRRQARHPRR